MAFSVPDALEAVNSVLTSQRVWERERLERIRAALRPRLSFGEYAPSVSIPDDAPELMRDLAWKSETNYLPLLVKTFSQVMKVDGYTTAGDDGGTDPWLWWQRNRMDSRQTGLTRSALSYGAAYATVLPGTYGLNNLAGPAISLYSPREMTALYQDSESDEWPMLAVSVDDLAGNRQMVTLYDEDMVYRFGVESSPASLLLAVPQSIAYGTGSLTFIDASPHNLGVAPVVRYRDRNLLAGEEQYGIVEPLMTVQQRINETTFQMGVAQYFQAFKQRYVIGWVPDSEDEELKAGAARIWYNDSDPADIKIDQLDAAPIAPYIESRNSAIRDFAALGQIPAQTLGIDGISNISDATLAGLEAAKNREGGEIMTSLGESHEQMLRLCALIDGNESAADDYESEVRWRNYEARSYSQTIDGITKLGQMLGIPTEDLIEDIPGMTGQRAERIKEDLRTGRASALVESLSQATAGRTTGGNAV